MMGGSPTLFIDRAPELVATGVLALVFGAWKRVTDMRTKKAQDKLQRSADQIHDLSNSKFGAQLKLHVATLETLVGMAVRLADSGQEGDVQAAGTARAALADAKELYRKHEIQQGIADASTRVERAKDN
jgi:hypothetical protein